MFGRRKVPFGSAGQGSPPPPGGKEPFPIEKMDDALDAVIRLFTSVLDKAGVDAGRLAIRGPVPTGVSAMLANCTSYRGEDDGGLTYLALGITADFKAFSYPPHCRLYLILNSAGICEDPHAQSILDSLAPAQLPGPLIDAHMMRAWIRHILPTAEALKAGPAALEKLHQQLMGDLIAVVNRVPPSFAGETELRTMFNEWAAGFPGTIGRPLTDDVQRMNGLPVTEFIGETLVRFLAELQARGMREQSAA